MKTKNIKSAISLFLLLTSFVINAQTISFTYDDAGNRLTRALLIKKINNNDSTDFNGELKNTVTLIETVTIDDVEISISPNPNGGKFDVRISDLSENPNVEIYLHSLTGKLIYEVKKASLVTTINITNRENGTYILTVMVNGTKESWKVVKQ